MNRSVLSSETEKQLDLEAEVSFVAKHASQPLSTQNCRILRFLAQSEFANGASQHDIAFECLKLDASFQPDVDAHVRVAVSRLRNALAKFYDGPGLLRPRHLFIPQGRYCLDLRNSRAECTTAFDDDRAAPNFAWTVSAKKSAESRGLAFQIEKAFPALLAQSPLLHDGAIISVWLASTCTETALERARDASVGYLAELVVGDSGDAFGIRLWNTSDNTLAGEKQLSAHTEKSDIADHLQDAVTYLTDPLSGVLPAILARLLPKSRLAVANSFFRFMATQDRSLLPNAHRGLLDVKDTHLDSPLLRALRVDSFRANYAFATGEVETVCNMNLDDAERVVELDPFQPYARLALSYYQLVLNGYCATDPAADAGKHINWVGSAQADLHLHRALVSKHERSPSALRVPDTFFASASGFLTSFGKDDFYTAEAFAFSEQAEENFWTRVFQCAVSVQLGNKERAANAYASLHSEVPGFEDFVGRALLCMLPDESVRGRICANLSTLS